MAKKKKFYAVWRGEKPGVYDTWEECSAQVNGFAGAEYKGFESRAAADEAFRGRYKDHVGKSSPAPARPRSTNGSGPVVESWCVDAACNPVPGRMEYRGVETRTGEIVFQAGPFEQATNNIGEFLALVDALSACAERGLTHPIYSDSRTAIAWVRDKRCKTTLERSAANDDVFRLVDDAEAWLAKNAYSNRILKWETDAWGEIPADYGRK
ncbi:MAG: ribonuclease H family protein [Anaerolineae bacterium]|nr:ribonuclease H family protein [Anaerolineae bacterium]